MMKARNKLTGEIIDVAHHEWNSMVSRGTSVNFTLTEVDLIEVWDTQRNISYGIVDRDRGIRLISQHPKRYLQKPYTGNLKVQDLDLDLDNRPTNKPSKPMNMKPAKLILSWVVKLMLRVVQDVRKIVLMVIAGITVILLTINNGKYFFIGLDWLVDCFSKIFTVFD